LEKNTPPSAIVKPIFSPSQPRCVSLT
jgi:hypothetical protein